MKRDEVEDDWSEYRHRVRVWLDGGRRYQIDPSVDSTIRMVDPSGDTYWASMIAYDWYYTTVGESGLYAFYFGSDTDDEIEGDTDEDYESGDDENPDESGEPYELSVLIW